ncbi:MAG TPA: NAD(P)/FAD-dependent oxidoreductase [Acidimicrobiia bacterium]|nr:NAD(P)/FAD-dependent oxidoreductase [Acidimicrobiia bacterium]
MERVPTVIVGGGPAGIATAAGLRRRGVDAVVLERGSSVAPAWRCHYDRLHLHTNKQISGLPGRPMPSHYPRYPSRDQVAHYLDDYAESEDVEVRLGVEVAACRRQGETWVVEVAEGDVFQTGHVVIATGLNETPVTPRYPNQESYRGDLVHSAHYRNGAPYQGKHVLVVGFGNSGGEIALDLLEHGAHPHISIRSPSVVVPRDLFGIPILTVAKWLSVLPPRLADSLSRPVLWAVVGDLSRIGVPAAPWGPMEQIATKHKIPMLDIGTIDAIRSGRIVTEPGIERFTEEGVAFTSGTSEPFDAVIFATGYVPGVASILESTEGLLNEEGFPHISGGATSEPGLYFVGFNEPPTGRLRQIGIEAQRVANLIAANVGSAKARP